MYISWHAVPSQRPRAVLSTGGERRVAGSLVRPQGVPALQQPGPISPGTTKCGVPQALSRLCDTRLHVLWKAVASGVTCKPPWAWAPRLVPSLETDPPLENLHATVQDHQNVADGLAWPQVRPDDRKGKQGTQTASVARGGVSGPAHGAQPLGRRGAEPTATAWTLPDLATACQITAANRQ